MQAPACLATQLPLLVADYRQSHFKNRTKIEPNLFILVLTFKLAPNQGFFRCPPIPT